MVSVKLFTDTNQTSSLHAENFGWYYATGSSQSWGPQSWGQIFNVYTSKLSVMKMRPQHNSHDRKRSQV